MSVQETRKRYKQTELGLIPEDWEVKELSTVGNFSKGNGIRKDEALTGDLPSVRYGEIYTRHNNIIKQFHSFISYEVAQTAKRIKCGDILFAGSGETKEEIGKSVAFLNEFEAYAGGDIIILNPFNISTHFLGYLLNCPFIQKQKATRGQGDAVVHISATQLGKVLIPIPTKAEQTAIANALSDADAYIQSLEKLIEKKRNIKQGAMQQLLKPKEGWVVKKLGDLFEISAGGDLDKINFVEYQDKKYLYPIYSNSLSNKGLYGYSSLFTNLENTITVTARGTLGNANYRNHKYSAIGRVLILKPTQELDCSFISDYINSKIKFAIESTGVPQLTAPQISNYEVCIPSFFEQRRISNILSDIDNELELLENKLSKAKKLKQGMMQELLTGKIRLV
jgi:type I restriction enzyme S subunit